MPDLKGYLHNEAGVGVENARADLYERSDLGSSLDNDTTDANGKWEFSGLAQGRYCVKITDGSSLRWVMYDDEMQLEVVEAGDLRFRDDDDSHYGKFTGALTAVRTYTFPDATGTLPLIGLAQAWSADQTFNDNVKLLLGTSGAEGAIYSDGSKIVIGSVAGKDVQLGDDAAVLTVKGTGNVEQAGGIFFLGDTANSQMSSGLTINQGATDDEGFALKSSGDVSHGVTDLAETDTFYSVRKYTAGANGGGVRIRAFNEAASGTAMQFRPIVTSADTSDASGSSAASMVYVSKINGTGTQALGATENLFLISNNGAAHLISKGNGDLHVTNTTLVALDDLPDALMGRTIRGLAAAPGSYLHEKFAHALDGAQEFLQEHRIMFSDPDGPSGHPMQNVVPSIMLGWDMAYQNASWIRDIVEVLSKEQRERLPGKTRELLALMPA